MRLRIAIPEDHVSEGVLNAGLETVTRLNEQLIRRGQVPTFANAVRAGVRWAPEPPGEEHFDHAGMVVGRKWGDCDDLAPWRAAELRVSGEDPRATAVVARTGPRRWHAIVNRSNGEREDPSRWAGMGSQVAGFTPSGVSPAACAPMFRNGRPAIAAYPNNRAGTWHVRADLPFSNARGYYLAGTSIGRDLRATLRDAVEGVCNVGACIGIASPGDLAQLFTAEAIALGVNPRAVRAALQRTGAVISGPAWTRAICAGEVLKGRRVARGYAHGQDFLHF